MKRLLLGTALVAMLVVPTAAQAGERERQLSRSDCRQELREDPREFERRYGGAGKAAIRECARGERQQARGDLGL